VTLDPVGGLPDNVRRTLPGYVLNAKVQTTSPTPNSTTGSISPLLTFDKVTFDGGPYWVDFHVSNVAMTAATSLNFYVLENGVSLTDGQVVICNTAGNMIALLWTIAPSAGPHSLVIGWQPGAGTASINPGGSGYIKARIVKG
jgi:hypothetical protein